MSRAELQLHEQRERRSVGHRDVVPRAGAVLLDDLERSPIHVLDRAGVDAVRRRRIRHVAIEASRSSLTSASALRFGRGTGSRRSTMFGAGDSVRNVICGDDAERAFGSDEEIDEVHVGRGVIAGRALRHLRHPIGRHRHRDTRPLRRLELEPAVPRTVRCRARARARCRQRGRPSAPRPSRACCRT